MQLFNKILFVDDDSATNYLSQVLLLQIWMQPKKLKAFNFRFMEKLVNTKLPAQNGTIQNDFPNVVTHADLLDILPSMVASFDKNLKIDFANRAFHKYFHTTNESLKQKRLADVVVPEVFKQIDRFLPAVLTGKTVLGEAYKKLISQWKEIITEESYGLVFQHW